MRSPAAFAPWRSAVACVAWGAMTLPESPAFRAVAGLFVALFAFAVLVQFNDPDPVSWSLMYAVACAVSVQAMRRRTPIALATVAAVAAFVWSLSIAARLGRDLLMWASYTHWEMKNGVEEEARECLGLALVAVWCGTVALRAWLSARRVAQPVPSGA